MTSTTTITQTRTSIPPHLTLTGHIDAATRQKSQWKLDDKGRFAEFPEDISEFLIPEHAGASTTTIRLQTRSKRIYCGLLALGLALFYGAGNARVRTFGLGLVLPGGGFIALGGVGGIVGFAITAMLFPLCLFAWFGAGGLAFPLADWIIPALVATYCTESTVIESSGVIALALLAVLYTYLETRTAYEAQADSQKRDRRNEYLKAVDNAWAVESEAATGVEPGSREVSLETLRHVQFTYEVAIQDMDDFSNHTMIDQFQTSSVRYQLWELVNVLAVYQCVYTPNFHGYISAAMRNAIEKSVTKPVLNFWMYETLWGKFSTNFDPVIKDNIMVTGFLLQALGLYESNTGDDRYTEKGCLAMTVTEKSVYKHDFKSLYDAVIDNWSSSNFCLYPCEPNWVYSMCNLNTMNGVLMHDRMHGGSGGERVMPQFYRNLEEDFFTKGGTCIPIKSNITGFTIPGLCGIMTDTSNSLFCSPFMPTLAKRMWLVARSECVRWTDEGEVKIVNLTGADVMDGGNYQVSERGPLVMFASTAAEWGDKVIRDSCIKQVDEKHAVLEAANPSTGSMRNKGVSCILQGLLTRSRLMLGGDWARTVSLGPPETTKRGPILEEAPYPDVLVAKAYSHTSKDLDLVLYPGRDAGVFDIRITRLQPGAVYSGQNSEFTADSEGGASLRVQIDGRTRIHIEPVQ